MRVSDGGPPFGVLRLSTGIVNAGRQIPGYIKQGIYLPWRGTLILNTGRQMPKYIMQVYTCHGHRAPWREHGRDGGYEIATGAISETQLELILPLRFCLVHARALGSRYKRGPMENSQCDHCAHILMQKPFQDLDLAFGLKILPRLRVCAPVRA